MIAREYLLEALLHEIDVCKHLFTKIPEGSFDFRLSDKQRSTLELLRYLASCGVAPMKSLWANDWSHYDAYEKEVENMTAEEFPAVMDRQAESMREVFSAISDAELENTMVKAPGVKGELPLGAAIMRTSYAWLVAYRMQLFLQVKAGGIHTIGTSNNWGGIDYKPREAVVEEEAE